MPDAPIALAAVAGAHGIGGEVRLKLFAESIDSLKRHAIIEIEGRPVRLDGVRAAGQGVIARLEGIASRDAAEALRGKLLTVDRSILPALDEGEYYWADIVGLPCVSAGGERLGTVANVENYGAGDLLEIERPDGTRVLVPFRSPAATLDGERLVIDPAFLV